MNSRTILLVDDNQDDVDLALRALRKCPGAGNVVVARDGAQALDYLFGQGEFAGRDLSVQPQVILLDLKMPKIDGLDTLQRLKSDPRTHNIPVVMLTSSIEERDLLEAYGRGVNSYIHKPVDFLEFEAAVQNLNHYWLEMNEIAPAHGS